MTKQDEKMFLEEFITGTSIAIRHLKTDVWALEKLIDYAQMEAPERALQIRREIRPLAVELLYAVIGTPKTFEEVLSEMDEQEDDNGN